MDVRFPLSLRNVGDLLHERGIDVCHETVRLWWHPGGVFVKIDGETHSLWRAVDCEGEVLESFVTRTRDWKTALKFLKKSLKRHCAADDIVTDKLRSYGTALRDLGIGGRQTTGRRENNRAETSDQPFRRRERAVSRFRRMRNLQKFAAIHAKPGRTAALAEWCGRCAT